MFEFLNKPYPFNTDLRYSIMLAFGLAIGEFLFILFFEPLELINSNFDSYLMIIAGFAGITLIFVGLLKIVLPSSFPRLYIIGRWDLKREIFLLFLIWILNSVASSFYLAFVGRVPLTMYLAFKIVLICLSIPAMILLLNEMYNLKILANELLSRNRELEEKIGDEKSEKRPLMELVSESRSEKLAMKPEALILVRSAENYVEIIYRENDSIQKKLMRSTMKSIEDQLSSFPDMVRCHRTCIINTGSVLKMQKTSRGNMLKIHDYEEDIPVSRQYLLGVKAALSKRE